ncbi:2-oxoacid:acceptor oxidoreductase subunit alpha [Heliophilum fasciatum]|uniref:2-oxoglutarate ferredoxin oxidoreductase subunit alpha n=1 Tax=Heliophilum fasciatum TaxID=35700 RepID=A0A4V2SY03_9FIRM|nr:2-oxoacid:acceptor oxidoreductase subunit alpha [Heliophilum fasciatum]MCW2277169.1 2-oxoglutarate ferredoxin oxidoreductase subunit alpha [Heliophilum fasciatum]TCP68196.1 2-oxoglutarate ferredoxin oxidoreductase subunit alpha [Heliophilum fasciatum]
MSVTSLKAKLMQGNQACAEGAIYAGASFYAGYPITPSTEIAEILSERLPQVGGRFIQMEDEIASMAAVIGASVTGAKAMTATSGPGFSLKQENIGHAMITEVPCVIANVMRLGPSTGGPTSPAQGDVMQARWGTHGDHPVITLCPNSVQECFELTVKAFNMAERFRTPVFIMFDEIIGHMRERVVLPEPGQIPVVNRKKPEVGPESYKAYEPVDETLVPPMASFGDGYRYHVTGLTHDETGFATTKPEKMAAHLQRLHDKINNFLPEVVDYEEQSIEDAEVVLLAYGSVARAASRAVKDARAAGLKVGLIRPITLWPFPGEAVKKAAAKAKAVIVAEMNLGQIINEVRVAVEGQAPVYGVLRADGEPISPTEILAKIKEVL